jgi:hypothetical protein
MAIRNKAVTIMAIPSKRPAHPVAIQPNKAGTSRDEHDNPEKLISSLDDGFKKASRGAMWLCVAAKYVLTAC